MHARGNARAGGRGVRRAGDRAAETLERFIEEMGRFYESSGVPRIGARIMALLLCAPEPLSAEQITRRLAVARSSVSTNVRLLVTRGAAEEVTYPADRLTYYRFSWSTWEQVIRRQIAGFGRVKEIAGRALSGIGADHPARPRIEEYEEWVDFFVRQYQAILDAWPVGPRDGAPRKER